MRARCRDAVQYPDYAGRGIRVCERWDNHENGFLKFCEDMGRRPNGHSLDRIDVNKGYCKANCRWATYKDQMRNRRKQARIDQFTDEELQREFEMRKSGDAAN